jgi:hypothetical protein
LIEPQLLSTAYRGHVVKQRGDRITRVALAQSAPTLTASGLSGAQNHINSLTTNIFVPQQG